MRADLFASMHQKVRTSIAVFDPNTSWEDLEEYFMETCGPLNSRAAVYVMLDESNSEEPERSLRQRVTLLVDGYQQAQKTYCGVYPEVDDNTGEELEPHHCTPFIPVHEQLAALKDLTMRCGGGNMWQTPCHRTENRLQTNPVTLLHCLLDLNEEALLMIAPSNLHRTKLHLNGRRSEAYVTTGDVQSQKVTLSVSDTKQMDRRAILGDELVEANRVLYNQSRIRGVNDTAFGFCIAANLSEKLIKQRHDEHQCYYCGTSVRGSGGSIVHKF